MRAAPRPAGPLGTPAVLRWSAALLREWHVPNTPSYTLAATLEQAASMVEAEMRRHAATRLELDHLLVDVEHDVIAATVRRLPAWLTVSHGDTP